MDHMNGIVIVMSFLNHKESLQATKTGIILWLSKGILNDIYLKKIFCGDHHNEFCKVCRFIKQVLQN